MVSRVGVVAAVERCRFSDVGRTTSGFDRELGREGLESRERSSEWDFIV